jgi:hypothetical protein
MNCKALEKQKQAKPKTSSKKEIIKIWAEINLIEMKGLMKPRVSPLKR